MSGVRFRWFQKFWSFFHASICQTVIMYKYCTEDFFITLHTSVEKELTMK